MTSSQADEAPAAPTPASRVDTRAQAALNRMCDALAAQALHARVESEHDAVQESGETLTFTRESEITVRRPDRLRVATAEEAGSQRVIRYDGRYLTLHDAGENVFAAVEHEADLDGVLTFVRDDVGIVLPLAPLFSTRLRNMLSEDLTSAVFVGSEMLGGEPHDHVALRYGDVGLQLWIPSARQALPRRLTLTFEGAPGRPQMRAVFREWDLEPDVSERVFAFDAPDGVRALPFALPKRVQPADGRALARGRVGSDAEDGADPAAGGLVSLERVKVAQRTAEADRAARETSERVERALGRPRSGRPVVQRPGLTTPAPAVTDSAATPIGTDSADPVASGAPRIGTILRASDFEHRIQEPGCNRIAFVGEGHVRCDGTWYVEALSGGKRVYVVVEPPPPAAPPEPPRAAPMEPPPDAPMEPPRDAPMEPPPDAPMEPAR